MINEDFRSENKMIDISLIEKLLFSNKYTAKELVTRWQISESAIKAYRQNKGSVGWRDWKGISIGKAEDIMKREGFQADNDSKKVE
ncbi:TPA: hypothetical protein IXV59_002429 [Enterococcus faecium]|nr:hypothetical protein [Enterococcus faecium]HAQ5135755.1 hypothetical protein [Enterococcus faecium]